MLRIGCMLLIIAGIALTGCENPADSSTQTATATTPGKNGRSSAESIENQRFKNELMQMADELQAANRKIHDLLNNEIELALAKEPAYLRERFPNIASFTAPQPFSKIQIQRGEQSHEITDHAILRALDGLIVVKRNVDVGSPPVADLEPVQYTLTTMSGTYRATIVRQGLLTFDDLYPGIYFEIDNYASLPGRAFGTKPAYLANMPTVVKMIDSGLLRIEDPDAYYLYHAGRIRDLALTFFHADKTPEALPTHQPKHPDWQATFYYYGDEVSLRLYPDGHMQLADGDDEQWFQTEPSVISSFRAILSAG